MYSTSLSGLQYNQANHVLVQYMLIGLVRGEAGGAGVGSEGGIGGRVSSEA